MESKLTLKLSSIVITRAKKYVRTQRGRSLSKLVENYFNSLTKDIGSGEKKLPPVVSGLAGVARRIRAKDVKKEYADYLIRKYR
jgi:Family of unknown function (DUF6364)